MGAALEKFLSRFDSPLRDGKGYRVRCPSHDDQDPSLHIEESADGTKVLLTCRAGCDVDTVVLASGARLAELYESYWNTNGSHEGRAAPVAKGQGRPPFGKITAAYDYTDERGALLFQVLRDEHKNFRQRRPAPAADPGEPQWSYDLTGVRRALYRLPEITAARRIGTRIYIVEGEKDVHSLAAIALTATTAPQGAAAAWLPQYTDQLAGARDVVIIPDNDDAGRKHAEKVRDAIAEWVESVKVLQLPKLEDKGDVSDWIAAGGTKDELEALATAAEPWITPEKRFTHADLSLDEFMERTYAKPRSLLGNGFLCAGELAFLYGRPGLGKTWLLIQLAIALSRGESFLGLDAPDNGPIRVGVLELELNAYFFQKRVHAIRAESQDRRGGDKIRLIARPTLKGAVDMLTEDHKALERWCREATLDLVIIDALSRAHSVDENKAVEFAPVLRRFDEISENTGTSLLIIHHEPKGPRDGKDMDDMDALRGSVRMSTDSKSLVRLTQVKNSGLFNLRFPKANNSPPIAPIWIARPKNSGFHVVDAPEQVKDRNVESVREVTFAAGLKGLSLDEVAAKTGLSRWTAKRHLESIGATQTGEPEVRGAGRGKKTVPRWCVASTDVQETPCTPDSQLPIGDLR